MHHAMKRATVLPFKGIYPQIGGGSFLADGACITGDIVLGKNVNVWFNAVARADVNYIRIGDNTNIQDNSVIHVTTDGSPTIIGKDVTIGHSAILHACTIEDLCLVGMGAIVLDDVHLEKYCFVAAGALLSPGKRFPSESLIVGSSAVVKRKLKKEEIEYIEWSAHHYVELARSYVIQDR